MGGLNTHDTLHRIVNAPIREQCGTRYVTYRINLSGRIISRYRSIDRSLCVPTSHFYATIEIYWEKSRTPSFLSLFLSLVSLLTFLDTPPVASVYSDSFARTSSNGENGCRYKSPVRDSRTMRPRVIVRARNDDVRTDVGASAKEISSESRPCCNSRACICPTKCKGKIQRARSLAHSLVRCHLRNSTYSFPVSFPPPFSFTVSSFSLPSLSLNFCISNRCFSANSRCHVLSPSLFPFVFFSEKQV